MKKYFIGIIIGIIITTVFCFTGTLINKEQDIEHRRARVAEIEGNNYTFDFDTEMVVNSGN